MSACAQAIAAEPGRTESYQVMAGVENSLERYQDALRTYGKGLVAVQATCWTQATRSNSCPC